MQKSAPNFSFEAQKVAFHLKNASKFEKVEFEFPRKTRYRRDARNVRFDDKWHQSLRERV
jgi:hypothetical protein